jgi:hypothetical protein
MSYDIQKSNGSTLVILEDGFIDNSTSLTFVGKNVVGYGGVQNDNFLWLLENFANIDPPANPIQGQIWFDSTTGTLRPKVYDGSVWHRNAVIAYSTSTAAQVPGDFWWDTTNSILKIKTDTGYLPIGPISSVASASRLANPVLINNVQFDGSQDITITASTTNELIKGSYITGEGNFNGATAVTWSVDAGTVVNADPLKVVARNSDGDIWYRVGHGESTSAQYADLAEKYLADKEYPVGTVIAVGGEKEVTACVWGDRAIGVVSGNPGYMMNSDLEGGTYIALKGRVPVKVTGAIRKKQGLIAANDGRAMAGIYHSNEVFAIALEDSDGTKDTIEAIIL